MRFLFLVCLLNFGHIVIGQQYNFISYNVEDGLAQSQVRDICQDQMGYLWVGTVSGLSRFDGVNFVNYSIDDGLPDNNIRKLYLAKNGVIWAATPKGIVKIEDQKIKSYLFDDQYRINDITEFNNELYLASNSGLIRFDGKNFHSVELAEGHYIRSIENYNDSVLFCGGKDGLSALTKEDFRVLEIEDSPNLNIMDLKIFNNQIYFAGRNVGFMKYNVSENKASIYQEVGNTILTFAITEKFMFGVGTNSGGYLIDRQKKVDYFTSQNGLTTDNLTSVFIDAEKNIWLGTDGKGLLKFSGKSIVSYSQNDRLSSDLVLSINQDAKGNFIFGTYDAGITKWMKDGAHKYIVGKDKIADNTIWTVDYDEQGNLWYGTSSGLTILNSQDEILNHPLLGVKRKFRSILRLNDSLALLGGDDGLTILSKDSSYILHKNLNINKLIRLNGKVYSGGFNGLYEFSKDFTSYKEIKMPIKDINSLCVDAENNLWIGTMNGLYVMKQDYEMYLFPLDELEYRAKTILGLIRSADNNIWVTTMNGVYTIDFDENLKEGYKIFNYGVSEGMVNMECNINALYEDDERKIWVGTSGGLIRIDPALNSQLFNFSPPIAHITGLRLFLETFNYLDYPVEMDTVLDIPKMITLPSNKNHLTFDFIGINLKDPKSVQYEYRMIGTSEEWSPISSTNYATYSFLQPGDYVFEVRAMNKNKLWSLVRSITFKITPPYWQTWWFISLLLLAISGIIYLIFQSRIKAIKQSQVNDQLGLQNRLLFLEQRSLNASMNRHFIFNSLNSIQYFINSSDKRSANKYLSNFANLIRKNLDSSAANNFIVSLNEEIERIELYLSLEQMRFAGKFDYVIDLDPGLDGESIEIPSMILQPFVENSIIHGVLPLEAKGKIEIKIFEELDEVMFVVTDNGFGIDNSIKAKKRTVDGDHESKGVEITNRRIELLRKLTGENLFIIGPFQLND
ncbi:ligand-binding sensor domain-containing protein [Crocinitomix catalasitica]|uniref:ligand-binding sensor domain-containing protein n=1 Tax=Crocinitomix catalasitica TaxID=184607 RepID=UPI000487CFB9|nr:sensor histidine kinase [Crocinitomix catalasitica]